MPRYMPNIGGEDEETLVEKGFGGGGGGSVAEAAAAGAPEGEAAAAPASRIQALRNAGMPEKQIEGLASDMQSQRSVRIPVKGQRVFTIGENHPLGQELLDYSSDMRNTAEANAPTLDYSSGTPVRRLGGK